MRLADILGVGEFDAALARVADLASDAARKFAPQVIPALASDGQDLDRLALGLQAARKRARMPPDVRVERAGKTAISGDRHQQVVLVLARASQQRRRIWHIRNRSGERAQHALHAFSIGARGFRLRLGAAQLRSRHHLHGGGDLLRRFDAVDPGPEVFQRGHGISSSPSPCGRGLGGGARAHWHGPLPPTPSRRGREFSGRLFKRFPICALFPTLWALAVKRSSSRNCRGTPSASSLYPA